MSLLTCKNCGTPVSDQAPACPKCGRPPFGTTTKARGGHGLFGQRGPAAGVAAMLVSLGLLVLSMILGKAMKGRTPRHY